MAERLVIVGGDAAGMSAASQARRGRNSDDLEITVFERGDHTSYSACGIPYWVGGTVSDLDSLIVRTPADFEQVEIGVHLRTEVTAIDLDARSVTARELGTGRDRTVGFDQLVIAAGAVPIRPDVPGANARGILGVQTLGDGAALRAWLEERRPRRGVVVGGGYIGLEMAEAMVQRGIRVALVERMSQPMTTLDLDMGAEVADAMRDMDIDLHLDETVEGFEDDGERVRAVTTSQHVLETDVVVLGLGVRPNTAIAKEAGVPIGESDAIAVDSRMRTRIEGVWAAGDCAEKFNRVSRLPVAIPLGTHANKEGRVAGTNLGGGDVTFPGVVGTAASKVCDLEVARTGLRATDAVAAGFEHVAATVDSTTRAGYFPGTRPMKVKMIVEKESFRLLGAQIVGREGAAKRIDVLATALWNEMTVEDLQNVDLSYAPPFSPVWDPVLIAARKAFDKARES